MNEIRTDEFKELRAEIEALRAENKELRAESKARETALIDAIGVAMPKLRETLEAFCAGLIHKAALDMEREFGSCVSFTAGSGARKTLDDDQVKASLASFRTQISRQADHLQNLQSKVQKLERGTY